MVYELLIVTEVVPVVYELLIVTEVVPVHIHKDINWPH